MTAQLDIDPYPTKPVPRRRERRFERIAITSVWGDPLDPRTWSGAPYRLAMAMHQCGVAVEGFHPSLGRARHIASALRFVAKGFGKLAAGEHIMRCAPVRDHHADEIAEFIARRDIRHVLHTGTLDLPAFDLLPKVKHYLYCDHTWSLSLPWRLDAAGLSDRARAEFERLERQSLLGVEHIFTFGTYVRDEIISHYGIPAARVSAVGSGMGEIQPCFEPKSVAAPHLLFIAKHLFKAKGGELLLDAFFRARRHRPDLTLTIVGDERSRRHVPADRNIFFHGRIPWLDLQALYRNAALLTQPMLNDPWGQVYLEALVSRTPVLGLNRHGLPEIVEGGRHGFLVERADPQELAETIVAAVADPARLAEMGVSGQRHVLSAYSWDRAAERIVFA
jgi:glycosyltransferase involved in cell wall biosynthesis